MVTAAGIVWFDAPVLTPDEIAGERVRDRAGMAGTVLVLAAVVGCSLGVLWAWIGGVL